MKTLTVLLALAALAGCATTPIATNGGHTVPPERVFDSAYLTDRPGTGMVLIKRDAGGAGSACDWNFYVNGRPIAQLNPGEKVMLYLPPDEYVFGVVSACAGGLREATGVVTERKPIAFRAGVNGSLMNFVFVFDQTTF